MRESDSTDTKGRERREMAFLGPPPIGFLGPQRASRSKEPKGLRGAKGLTVQGPEGPL